MELAARAGRSKRVRDFEHLRREAPGLGGYSRNFVLRTRQFPVRPRPLPLQQIANSKLLRRRQHRAEECDGCFVEARETHFEGRGLADSIPNRLGLQWTCRAKK